MSEIKGKSAEARMAEMLRSVQGRFLGFSKFGVDYDYWVEFMKLVAPKTSISEILSGSDEAKDELERLAKLAEGSLPMEGVWRKATSDCGYDAEGDVEAAYLSGVALFAFKPKGSDGYCQCVVTGVMTCGGANLDEAKAAGVAAALNGGKFEADRRMSKAKFEKKAFGTGSQKKPRI